MNKNQTVLIYFTLSIGLLHEHCWLFYSSEASAAWIIYESFVEAREGHSESIHVIDIVDMTNEHWLLNTNC